MKRLGLIFILIFSFSGFAYVENLTTLEGRQFKSDKEKLFVLFWATWCSECKDKMKCDLPLLQQQTDLEVVTINIDNSLGRVKHYLKKRKPGVTVLRDQNKVLIKKLEVGPVPHWAYLKKISGKWQIIDHAVAFERARIDQALKQN